MWIWVGAGTTVVLLSSSTARARVKRAITGQTTALLPAGRKVGKGQKYLRQRTKTHKHRGIDVGAPKGSPIYAPMAGKIAAYWKDGTVSGYGNALVIRHAGTDQTLYAHLDTFAPGLKKGSKIIKGQLIGYVGQTQKPRAEMRTAPHLHFEVHKQHILKINENSPVREDPELWLARHGVPVIGA